LRGTNVSRAIRANEEKQGSGNITVLGENYHSLALQFASLAKRRTFMPLRRATLEQSRAVVWLGASTNKHVRSLFNTADIQGVLRWIAGVLERRGHRLFDG